MEQLKLVRHSLCLTIAEDEALLAAASWPYQKDDQPAHTKSYDDYDDDHYDDDDYYYCYYTLDQKPLSST